MTVDLGNDVLEVTVSDDDFVVTATIDRPDARNAMNDDVIDGLLDVFAFADAGPARVVVIRGAGEAFSAGGDLASMPIGEGAMAYRESFTALSDVMVAMREMDALTVAAVDGYCLAGGLGLAASCEFVVASERATFGTPEVNVGLFPVQAMAPIMRAVPEKRGLRLLFTGERIDAREAFDLGLVTEVVPDDEFDGAVGDLVSDLCRASPVVIATGKRAYYAQRDMSFDQALTYLGDVVSLLAMSDDAAEGIQAFLEHREPSWRGR